MTQFTDQDLQQLNAHKLTINQINQQLKNFQQGFPFINIASAAVAENGIMTSPSTEFAQFYDKAKHDYKITKFVPASGAATRMFKDLFEYLATGEMNKTTQTVLDNLAEFAFYDDLTQVLPADAQPKDIIKCIIDKSGLNYGNLPKGLLKFHNDGKSGITAVAEHLSEGAQYASSNGVADIHFTVSPEHQAGFTELLNKIIPEYESAMGVKYNISLSTQKSETDTIAVNMDNTPFRNEDNTLLFRPAGHGALIENLNDLDANIIFIKNIDNVSPTDTRSDTILYKKILAGIAIHTQQQIFKYIKDIDTGTADTAEIQQYISNNLGIRNFDIADIRNILNRPLRICGMVRNSGAPGGGPFWTKNQDGTETLQIIEPGQIAPESLSILHQGQYFNPVDLVCMPYDYTGKKFNLSEFIDENTGFISTKSKNGRDLRAMERPGLWNGAMSKWNTIFVEVPNTTFTPAKVITDLLNSGHKTNK
ncbi:MAG: DUF4301 family protein [Alphaproteobacteria bacterium]|nr:DUF4301 family protein [Alphaproteobacteria bacterium]